MRRGSRLKCHEDEIEEFQGRGAARLIKEEINIMTNDIYTIYKH